MAHDVQNGLPYGFLAGLGYAGVEVLDPVAWRDFATGVCGFEPSPIPPGPRPAGRPEPAPDSRGIAADGTLYLKMDDRQWRLAAHPGERCGLRYLGFELREERNLDTAIASISKCGVEIRQGTRAECAARGVDGMAVFADPSGHRLELFTRPVVDGPGTRAAEIEFLTGPLGMGHAVLYVDEIDRALDFYRGVLGFKRTDYMRFGPDGLGIHFLRCTQRHHSLALLQVGVPAGLQHLMFESTTFDGVGMALDRARAAGVRITSELGRHRNDKTVSFYMRAPTGAEAVNAGESGDRDGPGGARPDVGGFDIEIGWDGLLVGDDWVEHEFTGDGDIWGHQGLGDEVMRGDD